MADTSLAQLLVASTWELLVNDAYCERYGRGKSYDQCWKNGHTMFAEYGADRACWPCRIRMAPVAYLNLPDFQGSAPPSVATSSSSDRPRRTPPLFFDK